MYLSRKQACEKLSVSLRTLDRMRAEGKFSTYAITPRNLRLDSAEIDDYMRKTQNQYARQLAN